MSKKYYAMQVYSKNLGYNDMKYTGWYLIDGTGKTQEELEKLAYSNAYNFIVRNVPIMDTFFKEITQKYEKFSTEFYNELERLLKLNAAYHIVPLKRGFNGNDNESHTKLFLYPKKFLKQWGIGYEDYI